MLKNAKAKETILKLNRLGKYFGTDRITLFVQFWFKFANKKHFKDQTVQFTLMVSRSFPYSSLP